MAAVRYSVSISNTSLVERFKRECKRRGRKQSWVIENAMRFYIEHPSASGAFGNGENKRGEVIPATKLFDVEGKPVKPLVELTKPKKKKRVSSAAKR